MTGYTPEQMPVLSALARGFATFDHWFCEVPSQTFTNRSFFHAASVVRLRRELPVRELPGPQRRRDDLRRLDANGLTWRVYCDPPSRDLRSPG